VPITRACSAARFTAASSTPGTFFKARSTRDTHEAQVMPWTSSVTVAGLTTLGEAVCATVPETVSEPTLRGLLMGYVLKVPQKGRLPDRPNY
jgi:hypothetical protein